MVQMVYRICTYLFRVYCYLIWGLSVSGELLGTSSFKQRSYVQEGRQSLQCPVRAEKISRHLSNIVLLECRCPTSCRCSLAVSSHIETRPRVSRLYVKFGKLV